MGIARVQSANYVLLQVPDLAAFSHLGNHEFDDRGIALMGALGADHQGKKLTRFDCYLVQVLGLGTDGGLACAIRDAMGEGLSFRAVFVRDPPFDPVAAALGVGQAGLDPHEPLDRTAPTHRYILFGARMHGQAPRRQDNPMGRLRLVGRIAAKPGCLITAPAQQGLVAGDGKHSIGERNPRLPQARGSLGRLAGRRIRGSPYKEAVLRSQNRPVLQVGGQKGKVAGPGPQRNDGPRHIVWLAGEGLHPAPLGCAQVQEARFHAAARATFPRRTPRGRRGHCGCSVSIQWCQPT